ncbi:MAG: transcriptional repressor [Leptolyngbya sp. RL_3_1]|nr:transcriptional repressor [Leptolyngbya sp. RL_3_1]
MSDAASIRHTPAQKAVLAALQQHRQPLSAQVLHSAMRPQHSIGLATVYRSLDALQKSGLIQHRITLEGTTLYSLVRHDRHCMTCLHCGQSFPINTCPVADLEAQLQHSNQFKIYYHTLEFFGLCESCSVQNE